MAEIRVPIPEMAQILENQKKMMRMLTNLAETPTATKYDDDQLMTGPEILHYLHCGRKRLSELVEQGKVEKIDAFGVRPRYKIKK